MKARVVVFITIAAIAIGAIITQFLSRPIGHGAAKQIAAEEGGLNDGRLTLPPTTISREMTFVTEPVGGDGYIDYFAALNQSASAGVTVENNAAVLFAMAGIGPSGFESPQPYSAKIKMGQRKSDQLRSKANRLVHAFDQTVKRSATIFVLRCNANFGARPARANSTFFWPKRMA